VHDVPWPHPWLGIGTPLSPPELAPELPPVLASSEAPPLLEPVEPLEPLLVLELVPDEEEPPPLLDAVPPDDELFAALPPPELAPLLDVPLPPKLPPVGAAELHPTRPSENATADTETMTLRFMTTPRLIKNHRLLTSSSTRRRPSSPTFDERFSRAISLE
jgi:hypothetical protein